jgi:transcription initiation factor TFIIB
MIRTGNIDAYGAPISSRAEETVRRIRMWDMRVKAGGENRAIIHGLIIIDNMSHKLSLPSHVHEKAAYIFRMAVKKGLLRGRVTKNIASASVYVATRGADMPVSINDIAYAAYGDVRVAGGDGDGKDASNDNHGHASAGAGINRCHRKSISASYRLLMNGLDIKVPQHNLLKLVTRFVSRLGLSEMTARAAISNAMVVSASKIAVGRNPLAVVAAIIYLTAEKHPEHRNQDVIGSVVGVTSVAIRNICREIILAKLHEKFV